MQTNPLVVIALVGLALVCVGLVAVGGFLLARRVIGGAVDTAVDEGGRGRRVSPKPDLRAIAQAEDFDAALARQAEKNAPRVSRPAQTPFPDAPPALGSRRKRRAPNRADADNPTELDDDALADFADDL